MKAVSLCIAIILSLSVFGDVFARGGGYNYGNNSFGHVAIIISVIAAIFAWKRHPLISTLIVVTTVAVVIKSIGLFLLTILVAASSIGFIRVKNRREETTKTSAEVQQFRPNEPAPKEHKPQKIQANFSWRRVSEEHFIKINKENVDESSQKIMVIVQPGYEGILVGSTKWQADEVFIPSHEIQDFWKY